MSGIERYLSALHTVERIPALAQKAALTEGATKAYAKGVARAGESLVKLLGAEKASLPTRLFNALNEVKGGDYQTEINPIKWAIQQLPESVQFVRSPNKAIEHIVAAVPTVPREKVITILDEAFAVLEQQLLKVSGTQHSTIDLAVSAAVDQMDRDMKNYMAPFMKKGADLFAPTHLRDLLLRNGGITSLSRQIRAEDPQLLGV